MSKSKIKIEAFTKDIDKFFTLLNQIDLNISAEKLEKKYLKKDLDIEK